MLHLYALAQHPTQLDEVDGIDRSPLRIVEISSGVDAVVSEVEIAQGQPSEAAILAHADVVEQLTSSNDAVLPARFGGGYSDEDALADAVKRREARVHDALERVRGCVEVGLRVIDQVEQADAKPQESGRAYMRGRLEEVRKGERAAAQIHETLAASARHSTSSALASPQLLLSAAYLVPRAEVEPFRVAVQRAERERPDLTFVCTGPWPPYSFAMIDGEPA